MSKSSLRFFHVAPQLVWRAVANADGVLHGPIDTLNTRNTNGVSEINGALLLLSIGVAIITATGIGAIATCIAIVRSGTARNG